MAADITGKAEPPRRPVLCIARPRIAEERGGRAKKNQTLLRIWIERAKLTAKCEEAMA
jgi:hypothetical protein